MSRQPVLFISHGAPTYALAPGKAGAQLTELGRTLQKPQAVLVVSPHWMTREAQVGAVARPDTIHDFGGFAPALYELEYPAKGHPTLAAKVRDLLERNGWPATLDERRGLDHGAWVPLRFLYPDADVPVLQLSMPTRLDAHSAFAFGRTLAALAQEGVLIVASGSLTHNLYEFRSANGVEPDYAKEFVGWVRDAVVMHDHERLQKALELAPHAHRAHPTAEHFLPLLIAAGASDSARPVEVLDGGFTHGVLSMESYVFGASDVAAADAHEVEAQHA
jgi:4,5-DOPA dioxygenase extradiol